MRASLTAGGVLFALVMIVSLAMAATGLHTSPSVHSMFVPIAIGLQVAVLLALLQHGARQGNGYRAQAKAGILASLTAAVLILAGSYLMTTVVFPDFQAEIVTAERMRLEEAGVEDVEARVAEFERDNSPLMAAAGGAVGTLVTGIAVTLAMAAFIRKR